MFVYDDHIQQFNKFQKEAFLPLMHYLPDITSRRSEQTTAIINQWAYTLHGRCEAFLPMYDAHYIAERLYPLTISNSINIVPILMDRKFMLESGIPGPRSTNLSDRVDTWCIYGGSVDCFYNGNIPENDRGPIAFITRAFSNVNTIEFSLPYPVGKLKPVEHRRPMYFLYIYVPPKMK